MPQLHTQDPRHQNVSPFAQTTNDLIERLVSSMTPRPGQIQGSRLGRRTSDVELDPMADGPGIMPLRPRRDLPAMITPEPPVSVDYGTRVPGDGFTDEVGYDDPESSAAIFALRKASGNLAPMLERYALGGYGNVDRNDAGRVTRATIHGDPIQGEATRMRALRDDARRAGDLNRMLASSRAQMIADSRRMDPLDAARYEREAVNAADAASPDIPNAPLPTTVEEYSALRQMLDRARTEATAFMDPTVSRARGMRRAEAAEDTERDIRGRVRTALANNPELGYMLPELRQFLGLGAGDGGDEYGDTGEGADTDIMTVDELRDFAADAGLSPEDALEYVRQQGITVR